MLLDLVELGKENFNSFHSKYTHSMQTRENLYEKYIKNQELREEEQKNKMEAQKRETEVLSKQME